MFQHLKNFFERLLLGRPERKNSVATDIYLETQYPYAVNPSVAAKYVDMYQRVRHDELSGEELASVVVELEKLEQSPNPYDLIDILCYTEHTEHKQRLVERYLRGPDDMSAKSAIWTLCSCWDLTEQYIDELLWFMEGARWDFGGDCQRVAVSCAGSYLKDHSSPEILRKIIELLEDEREDDRGVRSTAYSSLVELTGGDWRSLPHAFNPATSIDPAVVKCAKARLAAEEAKNSPQTTP